MTLSLFSKLVGHVPIELFFLVFTFLRAHEDNQVAVEVTGSRKLENGLFEGGALIPNFEP